MKNKIFIITILTLILLVSLVSSFAPFFIDAQLPEDNHYWRLGEDNITEFVGQCHPFTGLNATNATIWTNISGTWSANLTNTSNNLITVPFNFTFPTSTAAIVDNTFSDGDMFIWGMRCQSQNNANSTFSSNRSVFVEDAPVYNTQTPASGSVTSTNSTTITLNITGDGDFYRCFLYSNQSGSNRSDGTWGFHTGAVHTILNNTVETFTAIFNDKLNVLWNTQCFEGTSNNIYGWGTNNTLSVESGVIIVNLDNPSTTYQSTSRNDINITATSTLLDSCFLWVNDTINRTITSPTSGSRFNITETFAEGHFKLTVGCNDTASGEVNASDFTMVVDTTFPTLNTFTNNTITSCTDMGMNFNTSEVLLSSSIVYGRATASGSTNSNSANNTDQRKHNLTFGSFSQATHQINYSMTDLAGNLNSTPVSIVSPVGVCNNLSVFTIYHEINLSTLESQIGVTDFIFYWNETSQSFITKTNGSSTNGKVRLSIGDVFWTSNTIDGTWFRNNTDPTVAGSRTRNVAINNSYVGLLEIHNFFDLSNNTFRNETGGNKTPGGVSFFVPFFAGWNNTGKEWVSHAWNTSWENSTYLGANSNTTIDAVWVSSTETIIVNFTSNFVSGNWSV